MCWSSKFTPNASFRNNRFFSRSFVHIGIKNLVTINYLLLLIFFKCIYISLN